MTCLKVCDAFIGRLATLRILMSGSVGGRGGGKIAATEAAKMASLKCIICLDKVRTRRNNLSNCLTLSHRRRTQNKGFYESISVCKSQRACRRHVWYTVVAAGVRTDTLGRGAIYESPACEAVYPCTAAMCKVRYNNRTFFITPFHKGPQSVRSHSWS